MKDPIQNMNLPGVFYSSSNDNHQIINKINIATLI